MRWLYRDTHGASFENSTVQCGEEKNLKSDDFVGERDWIAYPVRGSRATEMGFGVTRRLSQKEQNTSNCIYELRLSYSNLLYSFANRGNNFNELLRTISSISPSVNNPLFLGASYPSKYVVLSLRLVYG